MKPVRSVSVQDFQSVRKLDLDFGEFTVLVGPSNSGKSAFLRAVRACLRNTFVPANVRIGATKTMVTVNLADAEPVSIERGTSLSTYVLGTERFTKSGRTVPEPVAKAIGMPTIEGADLNFTFQFDRPFLLAETGSQAAQVVGSLTNITLLHDAAREANRRRSEANQKLRIRQADVERYTLQAEEFADLPQEQQLIKFSEENLNEIEKIQADLNQLRDLTERARQASRVLAEIEVPPEPDASVEQEIEDLGRSLSQLRTAREAIRSIRTAADDIRTLVARAQQLKAAADHDDEEYQRVLHELGICPVCGSAT